MSGRNSAESPQGTARGIFLMARDLPQVNNQSTSKVRDGSEFSSAFGALEFTSGKHEIDYAISRQGDG